MPEEPADVGEELTVVRDLRGQRRSDGLEGERQVRRELAEGAGSARRRARLLGAARRSRRLCRNRVRIPAPEARVEAEPFELVADLLIESREEPALVGGGIESLEVRFVGSRWRLVGRRAWLVGGRGNAVVEQLFELRRVRQEELLVATLLLQPPQLGAAGVRLAERDETEDGDEGEQRGDDERADELLRPDRERNPCDPPTSEAQPKVRSRRATSIGSGATSIEGMLSPTIAVISPAQVAAHLVGELAHAHRLRQVAVEALSEESLLVAAHRRTR